ncbi:MAG TPA: hypothetical protein VMM55_01225 [Thermohalobaculum sp.]|nr:hypothetical protein [Thermohalobaculum sp.]
MRSVSGGAFLGWTALITAFFAALDQWEAGAAAGIAARAAVLLLIALAMLRVRLTGRVFGLVGLALVAWALVSRDDWAALTASALASAAFVAGLFVALAWLRNAAATSRATAEAGLYLAEQPPGRRYLALTLGGHLFALVLNYGAIQLLGALAGSSSAREPNEEVRTIRLRRMLLAIHRGLVATLCWSPLTFSIAITTALIPGASWTAALPYCLVSAALFAGIGWAMDTIFKPKLSGPRPPPQHPHGTWRTLWPLGVLLGVLLSIIGVLQAATGLRAIAVVMVVVPIVSLGWMAAQGRRRHRVLAFLGVRVRRFVTRDLPGYRSELVLLMMAGFIGTLGSGLLAPHVDEGALDLTAIPPWLLLTGLVWLIPLTGQIGMNPILSVSLIAPLLPPAEALGLSPTSLVIAITGGWALSGASSPYTATTLLVGSFGGLSAHRVGLRWNGAYTLVTGTAVCAWAVLLGEVLLA